MKTHNSIIARWHRVVFRISCAIIMMAITVLVAWHADIPVIVHVFQGFVPMRFNSALCFLAIGVSGIGLSTQKRPLLLSGGIVAAFMGAAVILEYVMNISFGIDTLFFLPQEPSLYANPSQMGPATAISFFLSGSAMVILAIRKDSYAILGIFNSIILSLALTSLIGNVFQVNFNLSFIFGPQMAVHSAVAFIAFGIAMLGHAWLHAERGPDGLPKWCAFIGVALLPALSVDISSVLFPEQTWKIVPLEVFFAICGVVLITLAMRGLATAKVAYKGFLMIAIPLVPLLIFVGLVVHVKNQSQSAEAWTLHSSEVIGTTQTLLTQVTEAESAVRGYAITRNEMFFTAYKKSVEAVAPTAIQLRKLVNDNSIQKANANKIELLIAEKIGRLSDTVDIIKMGNKKLLEERVKGGQGTALMARIKDEVTAFLQEEARLGLERRRSLDASLQRLSWLLITGTVSAILLAGILILSFSGGIGRRLKRLQDNANSLAMGNELAPVLTGHDEIAELDRVFHEMAESLREKRILHEHAVDIRHTEALLKTGALQNAIFNSANFSSIATDAKGVIQIFNVGAECMLGYTAAEVMNKITPADISDPEEVIARAKSLSLELKTNIKPGFEALVFKASRGIEDIYELTYIRKNGSRFPAVVSVTALRDVNESIIGYLLIGTDTTARKIAEDQLSSFFVLSLDMLCVCSVDGYFKRVNPAFTQTLGWSAEEFLMRPFIDFVHPDDQAITLREISKQIAIGKKVLNLENRYLHKDGSWRLFSWTYVPYADELMFAAARDITEQRISERALIEAKAESEKANQAKSEFLSVMSHEIRTPLNGVIGMVDVLHQSSLKGYQVEIVDTIRSSAYSLLSIIEDILDFSKIEAGKLEIEHVRMSIESELETVCTMLDNMAEKKNVELTLFTDPEIPTVVLSDAKRLHQIILNLTSNAIKFSSEQDHLGKVSVQAKLLALDAKQALVEIRVSDNGIGMDKVTQKRLFTAFTQADASTTRRFGGTGLGLTIVRNLVELMGGTIAVQSKLGKGSVFTVNLPLTVGEEDDNGVEDQSLVAGLNCLVVGKPDGIGDYLAAYLKYGGANVERVSNLSKVRQHKENTPQSGLWIWIVDASNTRPLPEELYKITSTETNQDIHLVLIHIQRGNRRQPRWGKSKHIIEMDGNCLTRHNLLIAVAMAAGRMSMVSTKQIASNKTSLIAPVRALALQQGKLILVAEDNATNQKVIIHQLTLLGFTADVASNGIDALLRWRSGDYALVLTDLNMPKMDGYELTLAIRAEEKEAKQTVIIALTANALKGEAQRCHDIGMNDYISKPVTLNKLKVLLGKWLPSGIDTITHASDIPKVPIDINVLKELIGDDSKLISEFLQSFHSTAGQIAAELIAAYNAGNLEKVGAAAHKLKSSARSVGALLLGELCDEIELAHKFGRRNNIDGLLPCFESEMSSVDKYLTESFAIENENIAKNN